jgi:hypothetical protein
MTSDELSAQVEAFTKRACARVTGVGAQQYDDGTGTQKFETLPIDELFDWTHEELEDIVVYATMLSIRLRRLQEIANAYTAE